VQAVAEVDAAIAPLQFADEEGLPVAISFLVAQPDKDLE
jgi:hypothetical protein